MAKIKFGMMMTDARGKLGGQVFSKNRAGAYVRTKVTPSNPRTTSQQLSRSILGALSASWSGLSDATRKAWNGAVSDWQKTDIFGDLRKPTGKNLFTSLNKELLQSSQAQILVPPEKVVIPEVLIDTANFDTATGVFTVKTSGDSTGFKVQARATPSMTQGTNFIDDKLRVINYSDGDDPVSLGLGTDYVAKFGAGAVGANIWVEIKLIGANGQVSVPVRGKVTVS